MKGGSGGKIVVGGDSVGSSLFGAISHTFGKEMPPEGDKLSAKEIQLVRAWIDGGLLEHDGSKAKKAKVVQLNIDVPQAGKPKGPPPMPRDVLMESVVATHQAPAILAMATSPWSPLVAIAGEQQIVFYHTETLQLLGVIPIGQTVTTVAFDQSGKYLLVGIGIAGKQGEARIYRVDTGEKVTSIGKLYDTPQAVTMTPDLHKVAMGGAGRLIKVWQVRSQEQVINRKKHTDWITAMRYTPDGVLLSSGDRNGGLWVWESETGEEFYTLKGHRKRITSLRWSADSNYLLSASEDGDFRVWNMHDGKEVKKVTVNASGVLAADWSRSGLIVTATRDRRVKIWGSNFALLKDLGVQKALPTSVALTHDGARLVVGYLTGLPKVWDVKTFKVVGELECNPGSVQQQLVALKKNENKWSEVLVKQQKHRLILSTLHAARLNSELEYAQAKLDYRGVRVKFTTISKQLFGKRGTDAYAIGARDLMQLRQMLDRDFSELDKKKKAVVKAAKNYQTAMKVK